MNKEEQVAYLANIYRLLLSDGAVDRIEEKALEQISRDIGAGYFERTNAMDRAREEGFRVQLAGRWSDRIRNFEDMIFAAFVNGVLEPSEKKLIKEYAAQLGIDQAQFDVIQKETKRRYAEYKEKAR
ncbi:MAG: hypothetical protein ABIK89_18455 [Planctomycetota bacterium]